MMPPLPPVDPVADALLGASAVAFLHLDTSLVIGRVNAAAAALVGAAPGALAGRPLTEVAGLHWLVHPDACREALEGRRPVERRAARRTEPPAAWTVHYYPDAAGLMVLGVDRSDDGPADASAAAERFDLLARATSDAIWQWHVPTNEAWWNARYFEMLEYPPDTVPGFDAWADRIHPEDRDRVLASFTARLESTAGTWIEEFRYLLPDGTWKYVLDRGIIQRGEDGRPVLLVGAVTDLTDRERAQDALREVESRFHQLSDNLDDAFYLYEADNSAVLYIGPAYERLWGRTRESLYANPLSFLDAIHPDDRARVARTLSDPGRRRELEYRVVHPDGTERWIHAKSFPIRDAAGQLVRVGGLVSDVTGRKQLEARLREAERLEAVGRLAGGIAHDFNNLLTVVLSGLDFAERSVGPAHPAVGDLRESRAAAERAAVLTNQLLAFARRQVIEPRLLDLRAVVVDQEPSLRRSLGPGVSLAVRLPLEPVFARVDRQQLEQILVHLADNARQAMPQGGALTVEVGVRRVEAAEVDADVPPGDYVTLLVTDTGHGMTDEVLQRAFEPFFTTRSAARASGLGLATCYGIVKQNGGHIAVDSRPGAGATVRVLLPRAPEPEPAAGAEASARPASTRVLVAEDETAVRQIIVRTLENAGFEVIEAASGVEALEFADRHPGPIALLVTDLVMPQLGGRELAGELLQTHPDLRIIFMSGYTEEALGEGLRGDRFVFLPKPFVPSALMAAVRRLVG